MSSDVLVVADHRRGGLRDVSYELLTLGRRLTSETGGALHVAVISGQVEEFAEELNCEGVDVVHTVDHGEEFNHDVYVQAVEALSAELDPRFLVMPHSVNGLDYAPAVASRLDLPLVTDATDVAFDGTLTVTREMFGSKVETTVEVEDERAAVTVRGGEWIPAEEPGDAEIRPFDFEPDESAVNSYVTGYQEVGNGDVDISDADVLVSVGRGIEEEENLELVERLADALGATLSASRPIVDNGWLPANRQVGQSGKVVTPEVYIAIGISGAVQHVAGMKGSDTIVAINTDPNAPIFDIADYGVVGDLFDVVPPLIEQFE
ncbi:electron transfer flavoprotein subunit alpha/FixB family protein [Halopelagius longus]|uniref:Electron transfer flavoprotein alpha subunit apoprotein n=1 Tax=Halopelagius longus TaxID=1236180 RepID=A0A1H1E3S1_9EURY|nr:electron transfer flavoprotein subunit alpha/FixB family protein [Halopelagius longus]RDI71595.1 electron transfer flavoprotein subunit alpha/FixB family protein [Halopelagius longus]SDQ83405.1 electron transfer flavoprotein alpha subunit apoprotein [Halopelagius longus]